MSVSTLTHPEVTRSTPPPTITTNLRPPAALNSSSTDSRHFSSNKRFLITESLFPFSLVLDHLLNRVVLVPAPGPGCSSAHVQWEVCLSRNSFKRPKISTHEHLRRDVSGWTYRTVLNVFLSFYIRTTRNTSVFSGWFPSTKTRSCLGVVPVFSSSGVRCRTPTQSDDRRQVVQLRPPALHKPGSCILLQLLTSNRNLVSVIGVEDHPNLDCADFSAVFTSDQVQDRSQQTGEAEERLVSSVLWF